ncbi:hypothetical protein COCNU_11G006470 [Cocos nucifera]|uniref:Uncharacterized protein n=1 Tax=Cocos nucifera TaxID=13894 RepID=A0A8K0IPF5_COCNU|nr:hypothetical protein COCNU_11G006470 [Cocos nucifera]
MLSTENPSDASCSSKLPVLKADERASEKLALQQADPVDLSERPTPNFSIRDYVFTSRSKGIETNWPFPGQLLQLCLKHGVSDLLPPFEPPDLVRAQCVRKKVEPEQPIACLEAELPYCADTVGADSIKGQSCLLLHELVVECSDRARYTPRDEGEHTVDQEVALDEHVHRDTEISLAVRSDDDQTGRFSGQISELPCSVSVNKSFSEASSELEVAGPAPLPQKLESSGEPSEKKCSLIVKLGAISVTSQAEDIVSNSSTVSDPMASKTCPVCKTFSSTSNTTLNAHMDQCLSVQSKTNQVLTCFSTPKVKPKKKRLMVDIYKTAPRCTLEDLDRRNGTKWALELALVTLTNEEPTETKRLKLLPMGARDEGAVYVDSNGIKLRILSKFNDTPPVMSREDSKLRKHAKDIEGSKCMLISKKKRFTSNCSENMKVKAHKKELSSFKLLKSRIEPASERDCHADTYKAKGESNISNACDQVNTSSSATLRPWVCSKRSDLPKKLNNKDRYKNLKNTVAIARDILAENGQRDSDNSTAMRSHILKVSRPSEDLNTASPRTKRVNPQSNMVHTMEYGKKMSPKQPASKSSSENPSLAGGLLLKLSRSSGTFTSSPRSKREEIHMGSRQKSDNSSDMTTKVAENCQTLVRHQACSTLEENVLVGSPSFSLEASKGDLNEKPTTFKRFRKHRSILRTGKREVRSLVKGMYASIRDFGPDGTRANETPRSHHFGPSEHVPRSEMGESVDQVSPSTIVIPDSIHEREAPSTMEELPLKAECQDPGNETRDMQVEVSSSFSGDHVTAEPSMKEVTAICDRTVAIARDILAENGQRDSDNSTAMRSHILKVSRPSEDLNTASPRTKRVNPQSNMVHTMEYGKKMSPKQPASKSSSENPSLAGGLLLKLSRSSGTFTSSPRSKREEIHMGSRQKSDNSSDMTTKVAENCQTLVRHQACSTLEENVLVGSPSFSLEASKGDLNEKPTTFKRFRKHRSILRTGKREVRSLVKGMYASIRDFGPDGTRANETPRSHHFGPSEHVPRSEMGESVDQVSPSTIVIPDSIHEREAPSTMEELPLKAECQDPGNETRDMQVEVSSSFSGDHVTAEPSMKEVTGDAVTSGTAISENLTPASNARFDLQRSQHVRSISTGEDHVQVAQRSLDEQEMACGDVLRDRDNQIADDVGLVGLKDSCASQYRECQADTASIQESSACLTSHGDLGSEVHQENSSATSVRVTSNHFANDGEPAESPESTASTVSLPFPKDSRSKDTESEILLRHTPAQDKLGFAVPSIENSGGTEGRIAERNNRESKVILPESKVEQFPKGQPFCCSCRESLSKESQLVKKVVTAGTTLPSKGKQISSLYIGPRMSSSFHPYQSPRANAAATCLESPTQSNATKISLDSPTNIPACSDFGSPSPSSQSKTQSNANPRLRLMGKDLMVAKKEEPVQPPTSPSDYLTNARCLSPLGLASTNFVVNHENFQCHHQLLDGGSFLGRPPSMGGHQMLHYSPGLQVDGFAGAPTQNGLMDHHVQQKNSCKNLISPAVCSVGRTDPPHHQREKPPSSTRATHTMQEVILIDDGPETEAKRRGSLVTPAGSLPPPTPGPDAMPQRQFFYFPSQNQFISRDVTGGPRPSLTSLYPRVNADFMKGEYFSQGLGPVLPSPFVFHSPAAGQLSSLYYSQTHH